MKPLPILLLPTFFSPFAIAAEPGAGLPPAALLWLVGALFGGVLFLTARHRPGFALLAATAIALGAYSLVRDPALLSGLAEPAQRSYVIAAGAHGGLCLAGALLGHYWWRYRARVRGNPDSGKN